MINYKKLYGWTQIVSKPSAIRFMSNYGMPNWCSDKRIKSLFHKINTQKKFLKFHLSDICYNRSQIVDFSGLTNSIYNSIYQKYGEESGFIYNDEKVHSLYSIMANQIILLCFKEGRRDFEYHKNRKELDENFAIVRNMVGCIIIPFHEENIIYRSFNLINQLEYRDFNAIQTIDYYKNLINKNPDIINNFNNSPLLQEERELNSFQIDVMETALKMFLFIKTAKVIDLTFISDSSKKRIPYTGTQPSNQGVIEVDSFYDENISVLPFQVKGHFRNQPKKNEKGEWYKELIYIDSFMKQGYHRQATKLKIDNDLK